MLLPDCCEPETQFNDSFSPHLSHFHVDLAEVKQTLPFTVTQRESWLTAKDLDPALGPELHLWVIMGIWGIQLLGLRLDLSENRRHMMNWGVWLTPAAVSHWEKTEKDGSNPAEEHLGRPMRIGKAT